MVEAIHFKRRPDAMLLCKVLHLGDGMAKLSPELGYGYCFSGLSACAGVFSTELKRLVTNSRKARFRSRSKPRSLEIGSLRVCSIGTKKRRGVNATTCPVVQRFRKDMARVRSNN